MKIIVQILMVVFLPFLVSAQEINSNELENKAGIFFIKGSSTPYTGKAITYSKENIKESSIEYITGIPNGLLIAWYPDGSKQVEGKIEGVTKVGNWTAWHSNGNKLREGTYKDNKEEGLFKWWFENGKLNKKGNYKNGIAIGEWEWYYENGNLKQIGSINGDTNLGLWKDYYENGKIKNEGEFRDGKMVGVWLTYDEQGEKSERNYNNEDQNSSNSKVDEYIQKMQEFINERDFNNSLMNVNNAISTIENKSEKNPEFMNLIAMKSKVYSLFNHLDEAERVILNASGISENDVEIIIKSIKPESFSKLKEVARNIDNSKIATDKIAPHIALSLIYNIIGDTTNLQKEQQLMMERSNSSDWVLMNSMAIYGVRASKEQNNGILNEIHEEFKTLGINHKNKLQQCYYLTLLGRFDEAQKITEEYLKKDSKDIDFLNMKLNIEMSKGDTEAMNQTKERILKINPKAFEE